MSQKADGKKSAGGDPNSAQAVQNYEAGLRALSEHKFERARTYLDKVLGAANKELCDRASIYLQICDQHLEQPASQFKSPEEHFDYAISLLNIGDYVNAREHLEKLLKQHPNRDYVLFGLAALDCLTGHLEPALQRLGEAIRINPAIRFQARNDSDFQKLTEDPRFTELLYPDPGPDAHDVYPNSRY